MLENMMLAITIGFWLSFMIGPVFFVLLETSITKGARAAIIFDLGVVLADIIFVLVAYFGSAPFLEEIKNEPGLYVIGGTILLVYGVSTLLKKQKIQPEEKDLPTIKNNYLALFIKGFLLNFINVGVLLFWLTLIVLMGSSFQGNSYKIAYFFTIIISSYFITDLFKILLAKQLKNKLTSAMFYKIKKVMGVLLIISGIFIISKYFFPPNNSIQLDKVIEEFKEN